MLCDDLEGWDGGREEGNAYMIMADLCCYMVETSTTL